MMGRIAHAATIASITTTLLACGGGSGGGPSTPEPAPTDPEPIISPEPTTPEPTEPGPTPTLPGNPSDGLTFSELSTSVGIDLFHGFNGRQSLPNQFSGGVAAADYDNDGDIDVYFVGGDLSRNHFYENQGNGTFIDRAIEAGVAAEGVNSTGPAFADIDGDGWLDLFVGAVHDDPVFVYLNNKDGTFSNVTADSGLNFTTENTVSATFADIDGDGDLDGLFAHWGHPFKDTESREILWRNDSTPGVIHFVDVSTEWGLNEAYASHILENGTANIDDYSYVPSTSDIDKDGDIDLLLVSDFGTTKVLSNNQQKSFNNVTTEQITDQFGMGSALGDFDNDGDIDWFVSSIFAMSDEDNTQIDPERSGNRLYQNDGNGNFVDIAEGTILAEGGWAWAACFADFNNDGLLDIFHVNGWGQATQFSDDASRLFLQNQSGEFEPSALDVNLVDARHGRGIACNDLDGDGDIDILISNNQDEVRLFRNELSNNNDYLIIRLKGKAPNTQALGAIIEVEDQSNTQIRELRIDNNFASTSASEAHFGFGDNNDTVNVTITWPDGEKSEYPSTELNQIIRFEQ